MNSNQELHKDSEFFYTLLVFQVEDTLFKVPQELFVRGSEVFSGMFELPSTKDVERDGVGETQPLRLDGIQLRDFRPFLRALCAPQYQELWNLSRDEWLSVLELSHMWAFTALREQAIKQLDAYSMRAIRRVYLARRYDIPEWIPKAYTEFVDREEKLTDEEAKQLGFQAAFEISRYREQKMQQLVTHFKSGHRTTRRCTSGHDNDIRPNCRYPSCWNELVEIVDDGCEIFDVPGAPT